LPIDFTDYGSQQRTIQSLPSIASASAPASALTRLCIDATSSTRCNQSSSPTHKAFAIAISHSRMSTVMIRSSILANKQLLNFVDNLSQHFTKIMAMIF
jgi:hypothetical protein